MKNNKIVLLIIATILIIVVAIGMVIFYTKKNEKTDNELNLKFKEVANLKKISTELPDFEIEIDGAYVGILDKNLLLSNDIEVYEFDAGIDNGWDIVTNHYTGVKLSDVLDIMLQDASFTRVGFFSKMPRYEMFTKGQLTDNIFLVFQRDGKPIRTDGYMTLLAVDYKYKYSIEDVEKIYFWDINSTNGESSGSNLNNNN